MPSMTPAFVSTAPVEVLTSPTAISPAQQERINWLQSNLLDTDLRNLAISDYTRDNALTRNDMVGLFQQVATSDNLVTNSEFQDLQMLVNNGTYLGMPDDAQNLADKVVNPHTANGTYQDDSAGKNPVVKALGNLHAECTGTQLTLLVDKWFLGKDEPDYSWSFHTHNVAAAYTVATSTSLFGTSNSLAYGEVTQGDVNDSPLLAAMSDLARQSPSTIRNMFIDNGDGTYTVRFMNGATADYLTVDKALPVDQNNNLVFAGFGQSISDPNLNLWVPLLEKAYAQLDDFWTGTYSATEPSYGGIDSSYNQSSVFPRLTGQSSSTANPLDEATLTQDIRAGMLVTLSTGHVPNSGQIDGFLLASDQQYVVAGYDGNFTLYNPSGWNGSTWQLKATWGSIFDIFDSFDAASNPSAPHFIATGLGDTNFSNQEATTTDSTHVSEQQVWLASNLLDSKLANLAVSDYGKGNALTRFDMLGLFNEAAADGWVTKSEFHDLQLVVANGNYLSMPEYVQVLANKVVNGDLANATTNGATNSNGVYNVQPGNPTPLGNIGANCPGGQLSALVGKWFLGFDHPRTGLADGSAVNYQYAQGSLFGPGNTVSYADITQGVVGDCYFLSALADVANGSPATIRSMIFDNGDGSFTVRFFDGTTADYLTVDRYLPANSKGVLVFAGLGQSVNDPTTRLWVPLLEKAYVQINQSDWIGQDGTNCYGAPGTDAGINGGFSSNVFSQITGLAGYGDNLDRTTLTQDVKAGMLVSLETPMFDNPTQLIDGFQIVGNHQYSVVGYNASTDEFTLFNPHGIKATDSTGLLQHVTWGMIFDIFSGLDVGANPSHVNVVVAGSNEATLSNTATDTKHADNAGLVNKLYQQVLHRSAEDQGLAYWTAQLDASQPLDVVAKGIFNSPERLDPLVSEFYEQLLLRATDRDGLAFWVADWQQKGDPDDVVVSILSSKEFYHEAGDTHDGFVKLLYQRFLDRPYDAAGLAYWDNVLDLGQETIGQVAADFRKTHEQHVDLVDFLFGEYFGNTNPTDAQARPYVADLDAGETQTQVEQAIIDSPEYRSTPGGQKIS